MAGATRPPARHVVFRPHSCKPFDAYLTQLAPIPTPDTNRRVVPLAEEMTDTLKLTRRRAAAGRIVPRQAAGRLQGIPKLHHRIAASTHWEDGDGMKEERNDFVTGLVLFLLAMGVILAALTYAISSPM
jgi:hypothetical protein